MIQISRLLYVVNEIVFLLWEVHFNYTTNSMEYLTVVSDFWHMLYQKFWNFAISNFKILLNYSNFFINS